MENQQFTLRERLVVCQRIARLVKARLPISGSLKTTMQNSARDLSATAAAVDESVSQGKSLADAIAGDNSRDARILSACIESGEISDTLGENLESWAETHIANAKSTKAMATAMLYPFLLILITIISLGSVVWILIPEYRATYELFEQSMPSWLEMIVWVREQFGALILILMVLATLPLVVWFLRRRQFDGRGLPVEPARRLRIQALGSEVAGRLLRAEVPLEKVALLSTKAAGGTEAVTDSAFSNLRQRKALQAMSRESSMLLSAVHGGVMEPSEAARNLGLVASQLRYHADVTAARNARWLPMLVALTIGVLTVFTYVFLIYLPWVWLMQQIVNKSGVENL